MIHNRDNSIYHFSFHTHQEIPQKLTKLHGSLQSHDIMTRDLIFILFLVASVKVAR